MNMNEAKNLLILRSAGAELDCREVKAFRLAVDALKKQIPKHPDYEGDGYDPEGELIYDTWRCPNCGEAYEVDYDEYDYCPNCGQRIDWSEEDDKQGNREADKGNDEDE